MIDASRCITATAVDEVSSSSTTTVGQTSDGDLVYITSGTCVCVCVCVCVWVCICVCQCACVNVCVCRLYVSVWVYAYMYTCTCVGVCTGTKFLSFLLHDLLSCD